MTWLMSTTAVALCSVLSLSSSGYSAGESDARTKQSAAQSAASARKVVVHHATSTVEPVAAWPVAGRLIRGFDPPAHPWLAGHRGVDISATAGAPVVAVRGGIVSFAGMVAGTPVVVVTLANGVRSTYEPVAAHVHVADMAHTGQQLGTVVKSSHCFVTCLHLGAKRDEQYLEPLTTLGLRPVLLPWSQR